MSYKKFWKTFFDFRYLCFFFWLSLIRNLCVLLSNNDNKSVPPLVPPMPKQGWHRQFTSSGTLLYFQGNALFILSSDSAYILLSNFACHTTSVSCPVSESIMNPLTTKLRGMSGCCLIASTMRCTSASMSSKP